jgi:DnaJ-domain-containing protein 1
MANRDKRQVIPEHFQNIVAIAFADGYLDEAEEEFLAEKASEFGLTDEQVKHILQHADQLEFIVPHSEEEKEEQLADAVYMSMINGEVNPKEYNLCLHLAEKMGMNRRDVDRIIKLASRLWQHH